MIILMSLLPLPDCLTWYVQDHPSLTSSYSKIVNNLFSFSSIGVEWPGRFELLEILSNIVITGRVYYRLQNIDQGQHPLRWYLYDEYHRTFTFQNFAFSLSLGFFQVMEQALQEVNPYISYLKRAITIIPREQPLFIEIVNEVAGGEVVAIIHFANVQQMYSRSILIHCSNKLDGWKVSILSFHYEPL